MRRGRLSYLGHTLPAVAAARRAVLGDGADAPPRVLVRLGPFPGADGTALLRLVAYASLLTGG